jgi:hypothetical protein
VPALNPVFSGISGSSARSFCVLDGTGCFKAQNLRRTAADSAANGCTPLP